MAFQRAQVELQYGPNGLSAVIQNPETGYSVIVEDVDPEKFENVFGEEVEEGGS